MMFSHPFKPHVKRKQKQTLFYHKYRKEEISAANCSSSETKLLGNTKGPSFDEHQNS